MSDDYANHRNNEKQTQYKFTRISVAPEAPLYSSCHSQLTEVELMC